MVKKKIIKAHPATLIREERPASAVKEQIIQDKKYGAIFGWRANKGRAQSLNNAPQ
jgi:hypothetical protein